MSLPIVSDNPEVQEFYEQMRRRGESHSIAEMLAFQQMPNIKGTDALFFNGRWDQTKNLGRHHELYRRKAEAAGVNTSGRIYMSQLSEFPGDPRSWISGTGDLAKICEERGWGVSGAVNRKKRDQPPPQTVPLDPEIVERETMTELAKEFAGSVVKKKDKRFKKRKAEVADQVRSEMTPHWAK